jgi:hypothetical protein
VDQARDMHARDTRQNDQTKIGRLALIFIMITTSFAAHTTITSLAISLKIQGQMKTDLIV